MSFATLLFIAGWGVLVWGALFVAQGRLLRGSRRPSLVDEVVARGLGVLAAGLAFWAASAFLALIPQAQEVRRLPLPLWGVSIVPLLLPPMRWASSFALVGASVVLTVLSMLTIALFLLVVLMRQAPLGG
ncbi:MAG: hypothetical protein NZ951_01345 [Dehalococcoidia bacterium]|nr:hypothetical protein [Dehalococcoidia bacterium]MDW8119477.1 hypothetical protein [Chloroflexota bacterium]